MFDAKVLVDQLLNSGKELAKKAQDLAENKLGIPDSGPERDRMISGLGKGALAGGLVAMLLGTKSGRKISGQLIKYGSIAAIGTVAFQAYRQWQSSNGQTVSDVQPVERNKIEADQHSRLMLRAMIAAANADGHIDANEMKSIEGQLRQLNLGSEGENWFQSELRSPASPVELSNHVHSETEAAELYLTSSMLLDESIPVDRAYLDQLAQALRLDRGLVQQLENSEKQST